MESFQLINTLPITHQTGMLLHTLSFDKVLSDCSEDGNQVKQTLYGSLPKFIEKNLLTSRFSQTLHQMTTRRMEANRMFISPRHRTII